MAVRSLRIFPDPILSKPSEPIHLFNETLEQLIDDLADTMRASPGVGLAAPQIGVLKRVSVIDVSRFKKNQASQGFIVLINPRLLKGEGEQVPREGCLSVPDFLADVKRYQAVTVYTQTLTGNGHLITAHGFEALALQHEIDHLNGQLFLDRVLNLKTDVFRRKTSQ